MTSARKPIDWSRLAEDYAALGSQRAVAEKYGRSEVQVCRRMRAAGLKAGYRADRRSRTHGCSGTRLYSIWRDMKTRCLNPRSPAYGRYGGRGISICAEWMAFAPFRAWALANGYRADLTIDRRDNGGDYGPSNCRWATQKEQRNNRRDSVLVEHNGEAHTVPEWSDLTGIHRDTLWRRLRRLGWSPERALSTPFDARPSAQVNRGAPVPLGGGAL